MTEPPDGLRAWIAASGTPGELTEQLLAETMLRVQYGHFWREAQEIRGLPVKVAGNRERPDSPPLSD